MKRGVWVKYEKEAFGLLCVLSCHPFWTTAVYTFWNVWAPQSGPFTHEEGLVSG